MEVQDSSESCFFLLLENKCKVSSGKVVKVHFFFQGED